MYPSVAPQSIYAPKVIACQGVGQPSDLSSITSSAPGLIVCGIVAHQVRIEQFGNSLRPLNHRLNVLPPRSSYW
jgi:hypothetical protein